IFFALSFIPVLIICTGIKLAFLGNYNIWSLMMIPVYIVLLYSWLSAFTHAHGYLHGKREYKHLFTTVVIGTAIVFIAAGAQIAVIAAKLDGFLNSVPVSLLSIPAYVLCGTICLTGLVMVVIFYIELEYWYSICTAIVTPIVPAPLVAFF